MYIHYESRHNKRAIDSFDKIFVNFCLGEVRLALVFGF